MENLYNTNVKISFIDDGEMNGWIDGRRDGKWSKSIFITSNTLPEIYFLSLLSLFITCFHDMRMKYIILHGTE